MKVSKKPIAVVDQHLKEQNDSNFKENFNLLLGVNW